jgi:transposase
METIIAQNVGVDISKATLDVHLHPAGVARQFANDASGIKALLGWLGDRDIARIVFEPTGPYHHRLERRLGDAGLPLAKVNPLQARRFAQAAGAHAKTDAIDAAMLARMGALLTPPVRQITSEAIDEMRELHIARPAFGQGSYRCQEP